MPSKPGFNSLTDPWVPALADDGPTTPSLRDALVNAHQYRGLAVANPLTLVALTRLLVALAHRVHPVATSEQQRQLLRAGRFDTAAIDAYCDAHLDRFEVFHPEHPFLQTAGLQLTNGGHKPPSALMVHAASGNNVPLFSTRTEASAFDLSVDEALLHLVTVLGFDTAAIKSGAKGDSQMTSGKTTGNPTGPLGQLGVTMPMGTSLFDTLVFNLPVVAPRPDDLPAWERTFTPQWATRPATGPNDLLTWPSRRIRLVPDESGERVVGAILCAGDRLAQTPLDLEMNTRWRRAKPNEAPRPARWQPGQRAWRALDTLVGNEFGSGAGTFETAGALLQFRELRDALPVDYPLSVLCVGVAYGNQSAVIEDVMVDMLPMPVAALFADTDVCETLASVSEGAEAIRRAVNDLSNTILECEGGDRVPWDKGVHPGDDLLTQLDAPTGRLLDGLQREPQRAYDGLLAWQQVAHDVALAEGNRLLEAAAPRAFEGFTRRLNGTERQVRLADAEAWFHLALRQALPDYQRVLDTAREQSNSPDTQKEDR